MAINVHHSIVDVSDLDLIPSINSWPCLDFYTDTRLAELVWVTEPHEDWMVSRNSIRLRIPAGIPACKLRQSLEVGQVLTTRLRAVSEAMDNGRDNLFESCDAAAACLRRLAA